MAILSDDIKLRESERMTDSTDGGGRRTLHAIADGVAGNIFPKVSRVNSVYGRVNLRKVYGHVATANNDTYADAHFIVTAAPDNDRIHVTAFSTSSEYDQRTDARDRIESYVVAGPESRMVLFGRQLIGAQALLAYQRTEEPLPEIGEVFAVSTEVSGVTSAQQFVRIQDVGNEVRIFTDGVGDFSRRVLTLTVGAPLRYEFNGPATPQRVSGSAAAAGRLRSTTVADASRYFGIQPVTEAASVGALTLQAASVYSPIVPTTQRETALSLASTAGSVVSKAVGGATEYQRGPLSSTTSASFVCARAVLPGSLQVRLVLPSGPTYSPAASDDGAGVIGATASIPRGVGIVGGAVDYALGLVDVILSGGPSTEYWFIEVSYVPVVEVSQTNHTRAIEINLATRGTVYTPALQPLPAPGTLAVEYRALGKWYKLRDDGTGALSGGDPAYGTGTVDYVTGGTVITLGALPDVGSSVILSWGSPVHYAAHTSDAGTSAYQDLMLTDLPVKLASFSCAYLSNGVTYTITANSAGVLSGGGVTGTINTTTGAVRIEYGTRLPDYDSSLAITYTQIEIDPVQSNPPAVGTVLVKTESMASTVDLTFTLSRAVTPGTFTGYIAVKITPPGQPTSDVTIQVSALTDGTLMVDRTTLLGTYQPVPEQIGNIVYSTGVVTITATSLSVAYIHYTDQIGGVTTSWVGITEAFAVVGHTGGVNTFTYLPVTVNGIGGAVSTIDTARTLTLAVVTDVPMCIDVTRTSTSKVFAGSLGFSATGKRYIDRNGVLYTDVSSINGSGTPAGFIDYATGVASLSSWVKGATLGVNVWSCLIKFGDWSAKSIFFRTAGSPLRPASFYAQVTADDGELLTGVSDDSGNVTGTAMRGKADQTMGVVRLEFGAMVTAAGNETQDWYDASTVVGLNVWKPRKVQPQTLRYSAVVLSNLPLNADILGLDPVRLPSDGRVPIYRPADVVVVHNTLSYNAGTPTSSQTINVGRTNLASLWLEDANKLKLAPALYTADLDAGTVTMASGLSLTGYVTPIAAKHRIEEMGLLSDVQINGQLTLSAPLVRAYPLGSFVSSALLFGDLFARATGVFDQATWTGVWDDALIGSGATAQYNDVDYPIVVLNSAAVSDRWRISFTSTTAFQVISENMGVIATGSTSADLTPTNALTGEAYFTLHAAGWGSGWSVGNQLRFRTIGAVAPVWLARTVLPGATLTGDSFDAQLRGDVD